jgi:hypothetical protein
MTFHKGPKMKLFEIRKTPTIAFFLIALNFLSLELALACGGQEKQHVNKIEDHKRQEALLKLRERAKEKRQKVLETIQISEPKPSEKSL